MKTYGYCRISTGKQNIERQIRNIKDDYPEAMIVEEIYTGTKMEGREKWLKLIKNVRQGDRIVFDSVSRMSRNGSSGREKTKRDYRISISPWLLYSREKINHIFDRKRLIIVQPFFT